MDNITASLTTVQSRESGPQIHHGDDDTVERARHAARSINEGRQVNENLKTILGIFRRDLLCLQLHNFTEHENYPPDFEAKLSVDDAGFILELIVLPATKFQDQGYLDRLELQFQAILAAFEVLRAWNSEMVESGTHKIIEEHLFKHFEAITNCKQRYCRSDDTSYQWHRCAYLLCISTEFFKNFRIDSSKVLRVLSQGLSLISIGLSLAAPAIGGNVPRLDRTLEELNNALKPISKKPKKRFEVLFALQELSHFVIALSDIVDDDKYEIAPVVQEIYNAVLSTATSTIKTHTDQELREPLKGLNDVKAALKRGAPSLEIFHLVYGSIDCAQQVLKLATRFGRSNIQEEFVHVLRQIVEGKTKVKNARILGKANEYLARYTIQLSSTAGVHMTTSKARQGSTNISINASITRTTSTIRSSQMSTDWMEPSFTSPPLSSTAEKRVVKFAGKAASKAGLSPDCKVAYFLTFEKDLRVGHVQSKEAQYVVKCDKDNMDIRDVALSNKYLVLLYRDYTRPETSRHRVRVVSASDKSKEIDFSLLVSSDYQRMFLPNCVATFCYDNNKSTASDVQLARLVIGATSTFGEISAPILLLLDIDWNKDIPQEIRRDFVKPDGSARLIMESLVSIAFDSLGTRLSCVTTSDRVLTCCLDESGFDSRDIFESPRLYFDHKQGPQGLTSVTRFKPPKSTNSYLFCTTWPGRCVPPEKDMIQADWPIVMPAPDNEPTMHDELIHKFTFFGDALQPQIAGAASPDGKLVAMRDSEGKITLVGLKSAEKGGIIGWAHIVLKPTLRKQERASNASMKFCKTPSGMDLFALDENGNYIKKTFLEK